MKIEELFMPKESIITEILLQCILEIQSGKTNDKVAKLCYAGRGRFKIIRGTSRGGYIVRKLNKPDSPEFNFTSEDFYILLLSLKHCKPVDGSNTRYLNQFHTPIVNSLKTSLNIELYNEKWFRTPPKTLSPPFKHDYATLSFPLDTITPFFSLSKLHKEK